MPPPSPPPRMVDPVSVLPLLDCPYCHTAVSSPVTLFCGHTLCASHLLAQDGQTGSPSPSPVQPSGSGSAAEETQTDSVPAAAAAPVSDRQSPSTRSRPSGPPVCPLGTCTVSARPSQQNVGAGPPVVAYPPSIQPDSLSSNIRIDSRISDIAALLARAAVAAVAAVSVPEPELELELEPDEHSDNESIAPTNTVPQLTRPPRPTISPPSRSRSSTPPPCPPLISPPPQPERLSLPSPTHSPPPSSPPRKRRKIRNCGTPTLTDPATSASTSAAAAKLDSQLLDLLTCEICFTLLYEPITTPCQHTFCTRCLQRTLDHNLKCPLCRHDFSHVGYFHNHPHNKMLSTLIFHLYPHALQQRIESINREERDPRLDTPVFVFQLSFPGIPTNLHIFEPRYRLMLRRVLQMTTPRFGMVISPQDDGGFLNEFGTMLEIRNVQMLADGRSIVETNGAYRFRIIEHRILDGYMVARVERFEDIPTELDREVERTAVASVVTHSTTMRVIPSIHRSHRPPHNVPPPRSDVPPSTPSSSAASTSTSTPTVNSESTPPTTATPTNVATSVSRYPVEPDTATLVQRCHDFLDKLRSNPMVVQRLSNIGPVPQDIGLFTFYVASVIPIDEHEKAKLLPIRSPRLRLRLVVHWIEQLEQHWWFQGAGCVAM